MVRSIRGNGRKHYGIGSSRLCHDHARRQSSNTAIASFDRGAEPGTRDQPEDCREVAKARDGGRSQNGAKGSAFHCSERRRRGYDGCFPAAHVAAAGRLSLCPSAFYPAPDQISTSPMPSTQWHLLVIKPDPRRQGRNRRKTNYAASWLDTQTAEEPLLRDPVIDIEARLRLRLPYPAELHGT